MFSSVWRPSMAIGASFFSGQCEGPNQLCRLVPFRALNCGRLETNPEPFSACFVTTVEGL